MARSLNCMITGVKGSPGYLVTSDGVLIGKRGRPLKMCTNNGGYLGTGVARDGSSSRVMLHRVVAEAFIPNPEDKETVNHKNGIKTDNAVSNLEWMTCSENNLHSYRTLGRQSAKIWLGKFGAEHNRSRAVSSISKETGERINYGSCSEAARMTGGAVGNIHRAAVKGFPIYSYGFYWEFVNG